MRFVALGTVKNQLSAFVKLAQREEIVILRHGKPVAKLVGLEEADMEDFETAANPKFRAAMARKPRRTLSDDEVRRMFGMPPWQPEKKPRRRGKT